jgi:hypothetical protein
LATQLSDGRARQRAAQFVRCLPLRRGFYETLKQGAISSNELASRPDVSQLLRRRWRAERLEDAFLWLIQLGVLRREVDGQGLTERVRLTPLGRQVLDSWPGEIPQAGPLLRMRCWLWRPWLRW